MENLTQAQGIAIRTIKDRLAKDAPAAEVKAFNVTHVPDSEVKGVVIVRAELGFPGDDADYRQALRESRAWLVSARGRVEAWNPRHAFRGPRRTRTNRKAG